MLEITAWHPDRLHADGILSAVQDECDALAAGLRTPERDRPGLYCRADFLRYIDHPVNRAIVTAALDVIHGDPTLVYGIPNRMATVTWSDVVAVAAEWLQPGRRAIVESTSSRRT